jgi:hypothetical protein
VYLVAIRVGIFLNGVTCQDGSSLVKSHRFLSEMLLLRFVNSSNSSQCQLSNVAQFGHVISVFFQS